jgi:hypothetical protein
VLPVPEIVPTVLFPPAIPSTVQATAVFVEPVTVAVRETGDEGWIAAEEGVRATDVATGSWTVRALEALAEGSAALTATTV